MSTENAQRPPDTLLTLAEVLAQVGLKKSKVYEMVGAKTFPAPIKIGSAARWSQQEVSAWIEQQKTARAA